MNDPDISVIQWRSAKNSALSRRHLHVLGDKRTFCGTMISTKGSVELGGELNCLACLEEKPSKWTER